MKITFVNSSSQRWPRKFVQAWMDFVEKDLRLPKRELTVVFLNPKAAQKLNHQFRQKNYATDILSFTGDDHQAFGELILCPQVVRAQAEEHDLPFRLELGYLLIHGLLHLRGYEHETTAQARRVMYALQDRCFARAIQACTQVKKTPRAV